MIAKWDVGLMLQLETSADHSISGNILVPWPGTMYG